MTQPVPGVSCARSLTARRVIPASAEQEFRDAMLRHRWDLPYIVVHAAGSGQTTHSGPYSDEVAALVALGELSTGCGVSQASMAQLHPPFQRAGED